MRGGPKCGKTLLSAFLGAALIAAIGLVLTPVLIRSSDSRAHVALSKKEGAATASV